MNTELAECIDLYDPLNLAKKAMSYFRLECWKDVGCNGG